MTTNIARTLTSNGSRRKGTLSFWYKKCEVGTSRMVYQSYTSGGNNHNILFNTDDTLRFTSQVSSSKKIDLVTTRVFRDPNAWYHIVTAFDTEQGTASNRAKMYINGVQETVFTNASGGSPTYPSQDQDLQVNISGEHIYFNKNGDGAGMEATCVYSHIHYIDGTMYDASAFGSFDSTTGEWKINTSPSVTYGTNGFFILKDGNSVTDQSGNSNDFSVEQGTLTNTQDCPSNNFCTINPLSSHSAITLSKGNTQVDYSTNAENGKGNLAFSSGKFYWEAKMSAVNSNYPMIGIGSVDEAQMQKPSGGSYPGGFTNSYGIYGNGNVYANGSNTGSQSFTYTTNDYIGIAVDLDSGTKTIKWFKNGTQIATYNITTTAPFAPMDYSGSGSDELVYNFGNGAFGTTQLTGTTYQGSGNLGIFKYQPPSGYTALCTKGLNE